MMRQVDFKEGTEGSVKEHIYFYKQDYWVLAWYPRLLRAKL